jgi:hypothetical protein
MSVHLDGPKFVPNPRYVETHTHVCMSMCFVTHIVERRFNSQNRFHFTAAGWLAGTGDGMVGQLGAADGLAG